MGSGKYLRALGNHADATQVCGKKKKTKAFLNFIRRAAPKFLRATRALNRRKLAVLSRRVG